MSEDVLHPPVVPGRGVRLALRALQVGAVAVVLVGVTLKVFELDRFFVPKEVVLHLAALLAALFALGALLRMPITRVDLWLVAYLALGLASAALAQNPWNAARALGVSLSGVLVFWVARAVREAGLARPLLNALALAVVLAVGMALAQAYGVETELFSINRAPGGTLGNRNFIAHLAAFGLPILILAALRAWRPAGFVAAALGATAVAGVLVMTRSRAAWLAVVAAVGVLLIAWLLCGPLRRHRRSWLRLVLLVLFLGMGGAAAILLPNQLRWRSDSPYLETARGVVNYQEGSGAGRLVQYRNTLRMALEHPVLGVGPGNWPVRYVDYAGRRDPSLDPNQGGMTSNPWPSSDWVALIAERGLPAFVLLVLAWVGLAVGAWRRLRTARDAEEGMLAVVLLSVLVAAAVAGLFDAVLLLPWPALLFWSAVGALWDPRLARPAAPPRPARAAVLGILLLLAGAGAARAAAQLGSMWLFAERDGRDALELAARLDPGSYRVRMALARYYGRGTERGCEHAVAARELYPTADAAERAARRCH